MPEETIDKEIEKLGLFGLLPAAALLSQLDSGQISRPSNRDAILNLWQESNSAYERSGGPSRSFVSEADLQPVSGVPKELIATVEKRMRNYPPFDSHKLSILSIEIKKLVTPQLTVNLRRLRRRADVSKNTSQQELFRLLSEPGSSPETVNRQVLGFAPNGGSVLYTSFDEDIRLHQPPQFRPVPINDRDPESPSLESMCFPVGGGTPFAYAFKIGILPGISRLILANGIHRACAAAMAGLTRIPLAICELSPLELPDQFVDTPKALLLDPNSNAPLVSDFADPKLGIRIWYYRQLRTVRFTWNFESFAVALK